MKGYKITYDPDLDRTATSKERKKRTPVYQEFGEEVRDTPAEVIGCPLLSEARITEMLIVIVSLRTTTSRLQIHVQDCLILSKAPLESSGTV